MVDEKYVKTSFCPLCESLIKDGVCTNKKCGNTQFEIDFMKLNGIYETLEPEKRYIVNGGYMVGFGFNHQVYSQVSNGSEVVCLMEMSEIKKLHDAGIPVEFKMIGFQVDTANIYKPCYDKVFISKLKLYSFKEVHQSKKIGGVFKYYLELVEYKRPNLTVGTSTMLGSNDLVSWNPMSGGSMDFNTYQKIKVLLGYCESVAGSWTLEISNKHNGLKAKTFFDKEFAYKVFSDREIKTGKIRRTALKHMVNDYVRRIPKEVWVDEHFSGDIVFEWRGLNLTLKPALLVEKRIATHKDKK